MATPIYPCIWFNDDAAAAVQRYISVFPEARIATETPMVTIFRIANQQFMTLNGGPEFRPNPSISFYVTFADAAALEEAWRQLSADGHILMALDKYDWSPRYGWLMDAWGVNWQLTIAGEKQDYSVTPLLMFCGEHQNQAAEAIAYYQQLFPASTVDFIVQYQPGQSKTGEGVVHSIFRLAGSPLRAMDSAVPQPFTFDQGVSMVISCDTQEEIDHYWQQLTNGGEESQCGWCRDRFGVWWQVVPSVLSQLMSDRERAPRVMQALLKMKKFDIAALERA
ncbi:VOC family protein [Nostoc ellipsosporum NOK]|nr:VOC family protein [Nostoc ellipsosporum NOK]